MLDRLLLQCSCMSQARELYRRLEAPAVSVPCATAIHTAVLSAQKAGGTLRWNTRLWGLAPSLELLRNWTETVQGNDTVLCVPLVSTPCPRPTGVRGSTYHR